MQKKGEEDKSKIFVYENANISLKKFKYDEVNPPTFYLIKENLDLQRELRSSLLSDHGLDSLNLDCALEISIDGGAKATLTPPIIEVTERKVSYVPQDGEIDYSDKAAKIKIPLICDGAHRVFLAKEKNEYFTGVNISGVNPEYPYYAHPNGWDKVNIVDTVPKTLEEKKFYRYEDCYALYRNFGVIGCGKPRGVGK